MDVILTHNNADFDALAALLAAYKLYPHATPVLPERLNSNVADFLLLYGRELPFIQYKDFRAERVERIVLVDTQRVPDIRGLKVELPLMIIDHHVPIRSLAPHETFTGEATGAVTTLLVEKLRAQKITLNALEATLLALGIYEDSGALTYGATTARDAEAVAWLLGQGVELDTVRRFLAPPLKPEQQALLEALLQNIDNRVMHGHTIIVTAAKADEYVSEVSSVAHRLGNLLDPTALFVVVEMPNSVQIVCRAAHEALDAGEIARVFGGGGHGRAAAATVYGKTYAEVTQMLWQELIRRVRPQTTVGDLMSYGVQTVNADQWVNDVIQLVRRVGHEGYPVVDAGRVIGLLTHRDAARVIEHGLGQLTVREVMSSGVYTLTPEDAVSKLEQLMVESGWGQIPVVNEHQRIIGIVTRTDLIRHWARKHPTMQSALPTFTFTGAADILGESVATLIRNIAGYADETDKTLYLVGGVVRDLLLSRANFDIDFVVEQNAIEFAQGLQARYGGEVSGFRPFGTAKWLLNAQVSASLQAKGELPEHVDFATARFEFYEHPTALPTVYNSSIKLDLQRRDFTINALAIQLSPEAQRGRILDFYGGQSDLEARLIRVLHSLSFVDDPTRIIRAVRFARRLGFMIEPRTVELMNTALPMLRRITGERVRNELTLLLREETPEYSLLELQARRSLDAIHPAFVLNERIISLFQAARTEQFPVQTADFEMTDLYWHLIGCVIGAETLATLCERLMVGQRMAESMLSAAQLVKEGEILRSLRPSRVVARLRSVADIALLAVWLASPAEVRALLERYLHEWRFVKPKTDGHTLRTMGLPSGPRYKVILDRLLAARLDGEVTNDSEETAFLQSLLKKEEHDGDV